ncbi:MAG: tyrosine-type recombinase/integrase [Verrucomicrobiota bacterium]
MSTTARGAFDPKGRRKYLNETEGRRFLQEARRLPLVQAIFCETIYYTGCRISEALNITGVDVDCEAGAVVIHTLKKRRKVSRRIPIPERLLKQLQELGIAAGGKRLLPFCRTTGWRIIKRVMKAAMIEGLQACPKGLRHGFGVRCALQQIPLPIIRDWMGHSCISTTEIYLAVKGEEERALIRKTW